MKYKFSSIGAVIIAFLLMAVACNQKNNQANNIEKGKQQYTCPMHPQIIREAPGSCPICGMNLIKKEKDNKQIQNISLSTLLRPTNQFALSGLPVTSLRQENFQVKIQSQGTIEINTSQVNTISALAGGRIERLYIRYRNQPVSVGTRIMDIYSPELLTAQQNLLFLLQNDRENNSMIAAAKSRLYLLGMSNAQVMQLIKTRKPDYRITVYSKYTGLIHEAAQQNMASSGTPTTQGMADGAGATTMPLSLREGMYVQKGQALFNVEHHDKLWAILNIFQQDAALIRKGDPVEIVSETHPNQPFNAIITYVEPLFREGSKTLTARAVLTESHQTLPIGSRITATIDAKAISGWSLPREAVLNLGKDDIVMRKDGGGFSVHKVVIGTSNATSVQILGGLTEFDTVAANAQYLIGSESFFKTETTP